MTVPGDLFRALRAPVPEPSRRLGQATSCSIPSPERLRPNLQQRQAGGPLWRRRARMHDAARRDALLDAMIR
jgi:hypothetical protein